MRSVLLTSKLAVIHTTLDILPPLKPWRHSPKGIVISASLLAGVSTGKSDDADGLTSKDFDLAPVISKLR